MSVTVKKPLKLTLIEAWKDLKLTKVSQKVGNISLNLGKIFAPEIPEES